MKIIVLDKKNKLAILLILLLGSLVVIFTSPFAGSKLISLNNIFSLEPGSSDFKIFWVIRIPRVLLAYMVGAILALSGMVFQAVFRNPLVCPFTLGVSSGASFGAAIYIALGFSFTLLGISGISFFSFLGAVFAIAIVWYLSRMKQGSSVAKMLLAGIAVSFFFLSIIMFIQFISGVIQSLRISRWLMGGIYAFGYDTLIQASIIAFLGLFIIWYFSHDLNLFTTGEELAISRGVDVKLTVTILFFLISIMIGGIVAICGPIGFVGIIAPHICRLWIGPDHRYLTPATFLFGGLFLALCDTLARSLLPPTEIPVGVITAILGGPFFLWLLHAKFSDSSISL